MKYKKYIKIVVMVTLLSVVLYLLFFFCIFLYALFFPDEEKCTDPEVSRTIVIRDMRYIPKKGKLYYYKQDTNFKKLVLSKELSLINESKDKDGIDLGSGQDLVLSLKYDYRLVVDDTICFDLNNYQIKPDTLGRAMIKWTVMCKLIGYNCNGVECKNTIYQVLDPPFDKRRIIKKGIYNK